MRRAAHIDANQTEIVKALRKMGAKTVYIKEPCDLLVGFRGKNVLLEVKNPNATRGVTEAMKLTVNEAAFHASWPGQITVVATVDEAMRVVAEAARCLVDGGVPTVSAGGLEPCAESVDRRGSAA